MEEEAGFSQMVAMVAWKPLQGVLTWCGPFWYQVLQAKYAMSFWLVHCSHGVLCSLNQASQHHFAQQAVGFSAELCYDFTNAGVTHAYRKTKAHGTLAHCKTQLQHTPASGATLGVL